MEAFSGISSFSQSVSAGRLHETQWLIFKFRVRDGAASTSAMSPRGCPVGHFGLPLLEHGSVERRKPLEEKPEKNPTQAVKGSLHFPQVMIFSQKTRTS